MSIEETKKALFELVNDGKLAKILHSENEDEDKYVNSCQVIMKCPCCDVVINYDGKAMCQSPEESDEDFLKRKIEFALEENIKNGFIEKDKNGKYKITEQGIKRVERMKGDV